ncbi:site-specific DNA-methyltransferase [Paenibacillus sp. Y412MC10]|uniref:site-specific DNA-methyltransferase n=1 Tax=Geobacillus sp. (strain Y412MC10) TaxID=481743 RepID=UPI001C92EE84|nr:site-specific DNA-methyltransferase [Paenibacillus sp. Y412MC10]
MNLKNKLELNWIGKDVETILEPRILLEDVQLSYRNEKRVNEKDIFENKLIYGDNLLGLKALEQDFTGKIKCVFIDPPYNTGSAFEHYDDGIEHSLWLSLMRDRLRIIHRLLKEDGSLWISIDDNEAHYLKVLCDEIFGRRNFVNNVIWEKKYTIANDAKWFSDNHDHILVYAKDKEQWRPKKLPRTDEMNKAYKNPDNHPKGPWKSTPLHAKSGSDKMKDFKYTFKNGVTWAPPAGTFPRFSVDTLSRLDENNEIWFGKEGTSTPSRKTFLKELKQDGIPSKTVWRFEEVGHNHEAKEEVKAFNEGDVFSTPKPERLLERIIHLATDEGDWVLDSFAGSGTTGAVAHKMGRRWIMIELGEHCHTHVIPRMKQVIDGVDQGGISKQYNWVGGGGFCYYRIAPSLLEKDKFGNWIINKEFNAPTLAEAMCKLHGFLYNPDELVFWKQGKSSDSAYIYTTTQLVTREIADQINDQLVENESLLICCKAYNLNTSDYPNITFEKIPASVLRKCEFGRDDYSFNITHLRDAENVGQSGLVYEGDGNE